VLPIVRVLEIPIPAWIDFDEKIFGTQALDCVRRKQQERTYTTPICGTRHNKQTNLW
jgi:hypothetical protein